MSARKGVEEKFHRILLIDDNEAIHEDFRKILCAEKNTSVALEDAKAGLFGETIPETILINFEVDSAFQGQEGLQKVHNALAEGRPYAMAFVDLRMPPGWDGIETVERIWDEYEDLLIVLCTAYSDYSLDDMVRKLGHSDRWMVLKKPFDNIEIKQMATALTEKWHLARQVERQLTELEQLLGEKTYSLNRTEAHNEAILNASPAGIISVDEKGIIQSVNRSVEQLFGYRSDELIGNNVSILVPSPHREEHDNYLIEYKSTDKSTIINIDREENAVRKDGSRFPIALRVAEMTHNGLRGFIGLVQDITFPKQAEDALRESEKKFRTLVESVNVIPWSFDLKKDRFSFVGKQAERILGFPVEYWTDMNSWEKLIHIEDRQEAAESCRLSTERGEDHEFEYRCVTQTGNTVWIRDVVTVREDGNGVPFELIGFMIDITERKQFELDLGKARDAAEAANAAKSDFLANMSHEIRTPMTSILGYTDLLKEDIDADEKREFIDIIQNNGEHLLTIINDILDLSKIEAGKLEIELKDCSPRQIVREVVELMKERTERKKLFIDVVFQGCIPTKIESDELRLKQILINLLGNAIKFTKAGSVKILTSLLEQDTHSPVIRFSIVDTGIGMKPEVLKSLFHPFTQADTSTTRKFGGTGLGLTISKRLTEMLGGSIEVISEEGKGSEFRVTLPTGKLDNATSDETYHQIQKNLLENSAHQTTKKKLECRVLLAEDYLDTQTLISFVLTKAGASVTVAENGLVAVELVTSSLTKDEPFDVILMDMQMPVLDGFDATRQIRHIGCKIPVIALTAHTTSQEKKKCLQAGCDDFLSKPIDNKLLIETVARYNTIPAPNSTVVSGSASLIGT